MSDVNYLLGARIALDELRDLLGEAADAGRPVNEIAGQARVLLERARGVLDAFGDDEGTE